MGVKPVYKLTTASGRTITTTGNHAYLARKSQITNSPDGKAIEDPRQSRDKFQINSKSKIPPTKSRVLDKVGTNQKHLSLFERGLVNTLENPFHSESPIKDAEWIKVYGLAAGDEIAVPKTKNTALVSDVFAEFSVIRESRLGIASIVAS